MKFRDLLPEAGGVGKIVPGVNTTPDVKPGEIRRQAAKFGNRVDDTGHPPVMRTDGKLAEKQTKKSNRVMEAPLRSEATENTITETVEHIFALCEKQGLDPNSALEIIESTLDEDLRKWFREKWVRFGPDGKIRGPCARGRDSEGKPKCLPAKKAYSLGKKARATAARRKRRLDPRAERRGKAKFVPTKESVETHRVLGDLCKIGINMPDADFWLTRKGSESTVGKPVKEYSAEYIGIKVTATDKLDSRYLFYVMQHIFNSGFWKPIAHGTLKLKHIRTDDVKNIPVGLNESLTENSVCPSCGGPLVPLEQINEKHDACYYKVKSRYRVWPSAYASGALVQCRKRGAKNWGKSK
jgi:hypothetical protein